MHSRAHERFIGTGVDGDIGTTEGGEQGEGVVGDLLEGGVAVDSADA